MHYCPFCGTKVQENETYCLHCGKMLPDDVDQRQRTTKTFNRCWLLPILTSILVVISLISFYFFLENRHEKAEAFYANAEMRVLEESYTKAYDLFSSAKKHKKHFPEADVALKFIDQVLAIKDEFVEVEILKNKSQYQEALAIINEAEDKLKNYHGVAPTLVINQINETRNDLKVLQLKQQLEEKPSIQDLKNLLWEIEIIKTTEAQMITTDIKKQIVDYTFSKASERLNNKQYNDALLLVEDGLKYVSDSEKLLSLKTTIDKEQTAFEIAEQQRIEQALDIAADEHEWNTLDAIKLESVELDRNQQDNLVVTGEILSIATIPINSILIDYSLLNEQGEEILSNKVFVFPDKLYPNEKGKFEFTHFDIVKEDGIQVEVNKITWYTD